ncbi:MAG TPA: hypothetical protein VKY27_00555 [Bacteriovoracaceae bacterium]|nr:hypothetical protein [Bacteriovoracaceae bacterium]
MPYLIHLLCLTGLFSVAIILQEKNPFEDGTYTQFTLSIIEDGDFNLINQTKDPGRNWLATKTGNHPNYEHPAIAIYLFPFIGYQKLLSQDQSFAQAHILATIFFLMLGLILLKKVLDYLDFQHSKEAIAVLAFSTPFLWFSLMASTTSNIFSLVYSIIILAAFCFNRDKSTTGLYFFLGVATTLGFAIRIQQFWIVSLFLYLFSIDKNRSYHKVLSYIAGALIPLSLLLCNLYLRSGSFLHPHHVYTSWTRLGEFWNSTLYYALFGPNGYFVLSPIYFIILIQGLILLYKKYEHKKLYIALIIPPTVLFLYYSVQWPLMDSLAGRHQLDYFFVYSLIIASALDWSQKNRKIYYSLWFLISLAIIWNLRTHLAYFYIDNTKGAEWQFSYFVSPQYLAEQFWGAMNLIKPLSHLVSVLKFLPLIFLLAAGTFFFSRLSYRNYLKFCYYFILWGVSFYFLFTQLNIYNNPHNVSTYRREGIYQSKVITSGNFATFYDDFIETHHKGLRWHLMQKDCATIQRLIEIKEEFIKAVKQEIIYDPIGFVDMLNAGKLRRSYLEEQNLDEIYATLEEVCPF